jgi:hypothetical protein
LNRKIKIREGDTVNTTSVAQAAVRSIALQAAKGNIKAFNVLREQSERIEARRQAARETAVQYKINATRELARRKREGVSGPEIIPHPDDIEIDLVTGVVIFNGPVTADQKMTQDMLMSALPALEQEDREMSDRVKNDPSIRKLLAWCKKGVDKVAYSFAKRASKINSWDAASDEERTAFLKRTQWPLLVKGMPAEIVRSEYMFKRAFLPYLKIEPTEEERQEYLRIGLKTLLQAFGRKYAAGS